MGPHWGERGRTTWDLRFLAPTSIALSATDADGIGLPRYGIDAAGYGNPGCATASPAAEDQSQGCAAGAKAGSARTCEAEPEADARLPGSQGRAAQAKDSRCKARGTEPGFQSGENRRADESAEEAQRRCESRQSWICSAAPATVVAPLNKVQTGGFGDPNGIPGKGDPNKATNVNRLGSPALPGGPGYGNGTGGEKGIRGPVASTGFGNGIANPPPPAKRGTIQSTGFADQTVATEAPKKKAVASEGDTTPVAILDKPRPVYTAEG